MTLPKAEHLLGDIRLYIFLIVGECGGLTALVWALRVLYRRYKSGGRISALVIMLLLSDLLELLLTLYIMSKALRNDNCLDNRTCWILTCLWLELNLYGLHFHQVVALEGLLALRHPHCSAHVFFPSCSVNGSIVAFVSLFFCVYYESLLVVLGFPLVLVVALMSCVVTCRASPQADKIPNGSTVLGIITFTLILHVSVIVNTLFLHFWSLLLQVFLISLQVILDPLLCVLVCREGLRVQTPQTQV